MWAHMINAALGVWLMAAPAVLGYGGAAQMNDRIVGPLAATFAFVAITEATRGCRWATLPLGAWMVVAPWLLGGPASAIVNGVVVGLAMAGLSLVKGRIEEQFGGGWGVLVRGDPAGARGQAA